MKIVATHQPNYIPWLGYFYKIAQSNEFVFLDDVQFSNSGNHDAHFIKTPQGLFRLKIPVSKQYSSLINEVTVRDDLKWREKHLKTIESNYKKAPFFEEVFADFSNLLANPEANFSKLTSSIIEFISKKLKFETTFINSSDLNISTNNEERILDICKARNATVYYSGAGARAYQDENNFYKNGITLSYSNFSPIEYKQLWGTFEHNITILDYLMNYGYDWDFVMAASQKKTQIT